MTDLERDQKAAQVLKLIGHPTRLKIVKLLAEAGPLSVSMLQSQLGLEQSLVSHYLIKMRDMGILADKRRGRIVFYELLDSSLTDVLTVLSK